MGIFKQTATKRNAQAPRRRGNASRPDTASLTARYSFQRNRTLTGSSSGKIASSNELNAELRSPRAHVHHLTNMRRKLLVYLGGVLLVAAGTYMLLSQLVATYSITLSDADLRLESSQTALYREAIESYYAARPAERLRSLLNEDKLLAHVQATWPEVQAIAMQSTGTLGRAAVEITPRTPLARWSLGGATEYVDASGVVFATNYYPEPSLRIVDNSGIQTANNQIVTSQRFLGFVGRVIGLAKARAITVSRATIPTLTTRQVDISIKGMRPYFTYSIDRSAGEQVEDMVRIVRWLRSKGLSPEYVDIRVKGKAFYR